MFEAKRKKVVINTLVSVSSIVIILVSLELSAMLWLLFQTILSVSARAHVPLAQVTIFVVHHMQEICFALIGFGVMWGLTQILVVNYVEDNDKASIGTLTFVIGLSLIVGLSFLVFYALGVQICAISIEIAYHGIRILNP